MRALAQRSAEAAKEIKTLIVASSARVEQGVDLVAQTGQALGRIVGQIAELNTAVSEIAASAQEQATGLDQINAAINQMDQVTQQNAAMVEEPTAAGHALSREPEQLARLIGRFEFGEGTSTAAIRPARPAAAQRRPSPAALPVAALKHGGWGGTARQSEPALNAETGTSSDPQAFSADVGERADARLAEPSGPSVFRCERVLGALLRRDTA